MRVVVEGEEGGGERCGEEYGEKRGEECGKECDEVWWRVKRAVKGVHLANKQTWVNKH